MAKALVTGGSGFIGSHLCESLLSSGHEVTCVDNHWTGHPDNISHLKGSDKYHLIEHDVADPIELEVDAVFNLACPASPPHYQSDPIRTLLTSVKGAANVLDLAVRCSAKIFQASTSEVYGDPDVHPQPEGFWGHVNPIGPRACYDEGKRAAETLFFDYRRRHGLSIKVARIFNTYGPRMQPDDGRVVSNFIVQALLGEDLTIYGSGKQTRSFCYVDDMVDGILRLMESPEDITGPVNLGNPDEYRITDLAEIIIELTGSRSRITHKPLPTDDPRQRRPDIGVAREALGWRPRVGLLEGLSRTIAYFDGLLCAGATSCRRQRLGPASRLEPVGGIDIGRF